MFLGRDTPLKSSSARLLLGLSLLATVVASAGLCQGKGHGVEVRSLAPAVLAASPGQILSLSFRVTNKSQTEEEFVEEMLGLNAELESLNTEARRLEEVISRNIRLIAGEE